MMIRKPYIHLLQPNTDTHSYPRHIHHKPHMILKAVHYMMIRNPHLHLLQPNTDTHSYPRHIQPYTKHEYGQSNNDTHSYLRHVHHRPNMNMPDINN